MIWLRCDFLSRGVLRHSKSMFQTDPAVAMADEGLSQFKDILTMYNHMSELCFNRCIINLNHRTLSDEEKACTDVCAEKAMKFNNRLMKTFMVEQPKATERRMAEAEKDAEAAAERLKAAGAQLDFKWAPMPPFFTL